MEYKVHSQPDYKSVFGPDSENRKQPNKVTTLSIPKSHTDLIAGHYSVILTTMMPNSQPQSTVVWCNYDGRHVLVNTMRGFQKERNMRRNPQVTIFSFDPQNPLRNVEIRGRVVEMTEVGAVEHNDELTMLYLGKPHFFGDAVPANLKQRFTPIICKIAPVRVRVECGRRSVTTNAQASRPGGRAWNGDHRSKQITVPQSHRDLLERPLHAVLTTIMPDGQPQSSLVWCDYDGEHVLISTTRERQKSKNMMAKPKVTLLIVDPNNSSRYIEVRGEVIEMSEEGAITLADKLTHEYTGKSRFYGDIYPVEQQDKETRVVCKIRPKKILLDAIFK
jgi:PPOX class probable F420-dependent enzyme